MKICINCNNYPISNSFFKLCTRCNQKRLNDNKERKPRKPARKENNSEKEKVRSSILTSRSKVCQGCGNENILTFSHTIPISLRKDLELEPKNIQLECMACHTIWEHGTPEEKSRLLNYKSKINYIQSVDPEYYERRYKNIDGLAPGAVPKSRTS